MIMAILPAILLIFYFFYGLVTGKTDSWLWQAGATLMFMLVLFIGAMYYMIQNMQ